MYASIVHEQARWYGLLHFPCKLRMAWRSGSRFCLQELELLESKSQGIKTKAETQAKYGW